jgi:phosphoglucosamine mutase
MPDEAQAEKSIERRYFGTDGVRGVVGEDLTTELVESLARAATIWSGNGRVFVGRDTRASSVELEEAFARGIVDAGGVAVLGGVLPTPAVALLALDLGVVITASHNPPQYNGVKLFDHHGRKLPDAAELEIESLMDAACEGGGVIDRVEVAMDSYLEHILERFGPDLTGLKIAVDCANGAYSGIAPLAFTKLGAEAVAIANEPDGVNINDHCGATDLALLSRTVVENGCDLGVAFDGDGDRMLAVTSEGELVDGDQILSILAPHLGVDVVVVTKMTNLGFHKLMEERGVRVITTDVGDRYVLEALRRENALLGGEQSGHIIYLKDHVTGDGLASALMLCGALGGRSLAEAAAVMPRYAQVKRDLRLEKKLPKRVFVEAERLNAELDGRARVLVRPSGTEPLVRLLAEAETSEEAENLCGRIEALVRKELGQSS